MAILPHQALCAIRPVHPFEPEKVIHQSGLSWGCSSAGYDVRIADDILVWPFGLVHLARTVEWFDTPKNTMAEVADKSTWARRGLFVQNTRIEPGWRGYLTIELTNQTWWFKKIKAGTPIAQIVWHTLTEATDRPYIGKYQDQPNHVVEAILEGVKT